MEPCRADRPTAGRAARLEPWLPVAAFVLFVVGFVAGRSYVQHLSVSSAFDQVALFDDWVVLLAALTGLALASALYFTVWLTGLLQLAGPVRPLVVAGWTVLTLTVASTPLAVLFAATDSAAASLDTSLAQGTRPITIVAGLCELPGLIALVALRHLATDERLWQEAASCRLRLLLRLRGELRRILVLLGAFLTLLVVTVGLRRQAFVALDPKTAIPLESVLLYGLVYAVLLGLFYAVAAAAVDAKGEQLLDDFAPLPDPIAADAVEQLGRRTALAALTGRGGTWQSFQTTVIITAPLLTALVGSALAR
jgi:hypothetical protein